MKKLRKYRNRPVAISVIVGLLVSAVIVWYTWESGLLLSLIAGGAFMVMFFIVYIVPMNNGYHNATKLEYWRWFLKKPAYSNLSDEEFDKLRSEIPTPNESPYILDEAGEMTYDDATGRPKVRDLTGEVKIAVGHVKLWYIERCAEIGIAVVITSIIGYFVGLPWWWYGIKVCLVALSWLFFAWVPWKSFRVAVTKQGFLVIRKPPYWWPFYADEPRLYQWKVISSAVARVPYLSKTFGYDFGTFSIFTTLDKTEDQYAQNLRDLPFYKEMRDEVNKGASQTAQVSDGTR